MSNSTKNAKGTVVESFKDIIPLSFGEEIGNSVSHGVVLYLLFTTISLQFIVI